MRTTVTSPPQLVLCPRLTNSNSQRFTGLTDPPRRAETVLGAQVILGRHRRTELAIPALLESVLVMRTMTMLLVLLGCLFFVVWGWVLGLVVTFPLRGGTRVVCVLDGVGRHGRSGRATGSEKVGWVGGPSEMGV